MQKSDVSRQTDQLRPMLDRLYESFNHPNSAADPIHIVRRFQRPDDLEIVGFCAAALAFGRVTHVLQSIERLLAIMGDRPAAYVRGFDPRSEARRFEGLGHRWTRATDLVALLWLLRQMVEDSGSIEGFLLQGHEAGATHIGLGLDRFSTRAMSLDLRRAYGRVPARPGVAYFFPRPSAGSAC